MPRPRSSLAALAVLGAALVSACLPGAARPPAAPSGKALSLAPAGAAPGPSIAGPLRVVFAAPRGVTAQAAEIAVVFNKPMRALGPVSAAPPATLTPAAKGAFHWLGSAGLRFDAEERLAPATAYRITIPAGTRALDGSTLEEAFTLDFETPRAAVIESDPAAGAEGVEPKAEIALTFNQAVSDAEIMRAITMRVAGARAPLPFTVERRGPSRVALVPARPLPLASRIEVRADASLRAEGGDLQAGAERAFTFTTVMPPRVAKITCAPHPTDSDACEPVNGEITVELAGEVNARALARALVIDPPVRWAHEDYDEADYPSGELVVRADFKPGVTYRVRVDPTRGGKALVNAYDQRLAGAAERALRFGHVPADVRLGLRGVYWSAREKHDFPVRAVNVRGATISAAKETLRDALLALAGQPTARQAQQGGRRVPLPEGRLDEEVRTGVSLDDLIGAGARGAVRIFADVPAPLGMPLGYTSGLAVQITDLGISARVAHGSSAVLVTGLDDGKPASGATVEIYRLPPEGKKGEPALVGRGTTDASGAAWVTIAGGFMKGERAAVAAMLWKDWAFAITEAPEPAEAVGLAYTERGLYRPGETASIAGVLRVPGPERLTTPRGGEVEIEVRDPSGATARKARAGLSEFGTFAAGVPIAKDAPLGRYRAIVRTQGSELRTSFTVAEYRPTEIEISAATGSGAYTRGDTLTCGVHGRYLHGGAMSGSTATVVVRRHPASFTVPGLTGFTTEDVQRSRHAAEIARHTATLDARGSASFRTALALPGQEGTESVTCDAEAMDLNRQALGASASAIVHPAEVYAALRGIDHLDLTPGATIPMRALAVTPAGERRTMTVRLEATRREGYTGSETTVASCEVTTGPEPTGCDAKVPADVTSNTILYVQATITDRRGNVARAGSQRAVSIPPKPSSKPALPSPPPPPPSPPPRVLRLDLPRRFEVGQTAKLRVESPFDAPAIALVTVEREGLLWRSTAPIGPGSTQVEIPILDTMMPNAAVEVTAISGPRAERASAWFQVDARSRKLSVEVSTPAGEQRPGQEIEVGVRVKDADGKPVRADVTLYAADEGTLSLIGYHLPDPEVALFEERSTLGRGIEARDQRVRVGLYGRRRARSPSVRHGATTISGDVRRDFRQTVLFAPHLVTDAEGRISRRVKLPDGLTTYRFMAVAAAADDRAGAGEAKVTTSLPLMARASMPKVLRVGDRFEGSVVVSSKDLPKGDAEIVIDASGVTLTTPRRTSLPLAPGEPAETRFGARVDRPGKVRLTASATLGGARDAMDLAGEAVTAIAPEKALIEGETRGAIAEQLGDLGAARPDYGGLDLTLASTPYASLADGIEQLVEYPYGCTEQTVSRMVPLLALQDLAQAIGAPLPADPRAAIEAAVRRVLGHQRGDGGFGLWPESRRSERWITGWALWGLGEARRRGIPVPASAEQRARGYLDRVIARGEQAGPEDLTMSALLVDLAAEDGHHDAARAAELVAQKDHLPPAAKALLLHALARRDRAAALHLAHDLEALVRLDGGAARVVVERPLGALLESDTRTTAMLLRALVALDADHPLAPRLARGLLESRRNGHFRTTQEAAWALIALDALRRAKPPAAGAREARVFLGDERLAAIDDLGARPIRFGVPMRSLLEGAPIAGRPLTFASLDGGALHYRAELRFARAALPTEPMESGMFVRRAARPLAREAREGSPFRAGEAVLVELVVVTPTPRSFVVLDSPLPGGFEAADSDLRLGGAWLRQHEASPQGRRELRDDRVLYFVDDLPAGVSVFRYVARATTPGAFVTPPARAEEMYAPETFGQTPAEATVIEAR